MAKYELKLPKMGEGVIEATLTAWTKNIGDYIEEDDTVFEVATDKVDSEVPSEVSGILKEKLFDVNDVVKIGDVVAVLETDQEIEQEENEVIQNSQLEKLNLKEVKIMWINYPHMPSGIHAPRNIKNH